MEICLLIFLFGKITVWQDLTHDNVTGTMINCTSMSELVNSNTTKFICVPVCEDSTVYVTRMIFYFLDHICPLSNHSQALRSRVVLVGGANVMETALLGDIGREENIVVISLSPKTHKLSAANQKRFPTLMQLTDFGVNQDATSRSTTPISSAELITGTTSLLDMVNYTLQQAGIWAFPEFETTDHKDLVERSTLDTAGESTSDGRNTVLGVAGPVFGVVIFIVVVRLWRRLHRFTGLSYVIDEKLMEFVRSYNPTIGKWKQEVPEKGGMQGTIHIYDGKLPTTAVSFPVYADFSVVKKNNLAKLILKLARDMDHPNICKFYGIMWTTDHRVFGKGMVHVSEYPSRGSLRMVIDDDNAALNWDLRFSLMWDFFLGLRYIHASQLRCHGSLTSIGIYVDERFTLKINGAGVLPFMGVLLRTSKKVQMRDDPLSRGMKMVQLWMAPEVVVDMRNSWTTAADTYGFGVILYEMSTRNTPFNVDMNNEDAFDEVGREMKAGTFDPKKQDLQLDDVPVELSLLIFTCWERDKDRRPDLDAIFRTLKSVYPQRSGMSFSDSLVDRLMHYSNELEEKVALQTENLRAEAIRVDKLLCDLLPYDLVRRLRTGEAISLEHCEHVTVLFTAVPVFSHIVGRISPFQLFAMLEHLCRTLDAVVADYTVFKVETIRDTYMIVGGVPVHIGDRHAAEVACLALAMLKAVTSMPAVKEYKPVESTVFEARAGIHSGPVVAGIIGTKLPHYTVFGDTVNTASRMETSGETSRIQISKTTYELLKDRKEFVLKSRGLISIKGKGEMETFWLTSALRIPASEVQSTTIP